MAVQPAETRAFCSSRAPVQSRLGPQTQVTDHGGMRPKLWRRCTSRLGSSSRSISAGSEEARACFWEATGPSGLCALLRRSLTWRSEVRKQVFYRFCGVKHDRVLPACHLWSNQAGVLLADDTTAPMQPPVSLGHVFSAPPHALILFSLNSMPSLLLAQLVERAWQPQVWNVPLSRLQGDVWEGAPEPDWVQAQCRGSLTC